MPACFDKTSRCPDETVRRIRMTVSFEDRYWDGKLLETYDTLCDRIVVAPCTCKTKKSLPKKANRARKGSFNFCSGNERRLRTASGMMKDSWKESLESEESMNCEIVEEAGEEWFQYLNSDPE
ncbi:protein N-terminal asparagine amidohydrolase [Dendrobium catenatum]|uniref:Protein N-terminal asparagine amidohydrolase n=1 Tax=Dendrobium catenatum TaxID=906689 RepID=A0A2I0WPR7_9ASPA|nr:protein N-terminal asparagine amidohydrolase [Dendrobium catenatum]